MTFTGLNKFFPLAVLLLLASILVSPFSGKSALGVSPSEFDISLAKTSSKQLNVLENFLPLERAVLGCCVGADTKLPEGNTAIGKVDDLSPDKLQSGEKTLLDKLPDQGSPRANWAQNSSVLRAEMSKGNPIRDASAHLPDNHPKVKGTFLGAERNLLRSKGWTLDSSTGFWKPSK